MKKKVVKNNSKLSTKQSLKLKKNRKIRQKKSSFKSNRLRYKGRFIPEKLEKNVREYRKKLWKQGKRIQYEVLLKSYFENKIKAIESNFQDYQADSIYNVDDLESGLRFIYYMFAAKLRDVLADNEIKRPKFYIKLWGDDFYQRVGKADLFIEKDEFLDRIWEAYSELSEVGVLIDSPKFTFVVSILSLSEEVYVDFNLTENIPDEVKDILDGKDY